MINEETVKKIAFLSCLKIEDERMSETKEEFNKIVEWIDQLNEVNTENVEPLLSPNDGHQVCREDEVTVHNNAAAVLKNAPAQEYGYFVVPKVVE